MALALGLDPALAPAPSPFQPLNFSLELEGKTRPKPCPTSSIPISPSPDPLDPPEHLSHRAAAQLPGGPQVGACYVDTTGIFYSFSNSITLQPGQGSVGQ